MVAALLTARAGGTWPGKNWEQVLGKPLCQYPMEAALKVPGITRFIASTDSTEIIQIAQGLGFEILERPRELCEDRSLHRDVLIHALNWLQNQGLQPQWLVVLLGNSAIIKPKWILDALEVIQSRWDITAVVPVVRNQDHHPWRAKTLGQEGFLIPHENLNPDFETNRQALSENYFLCHNFWIIKTEAIYENKGLGPWGFMGERVLPYVVDQGFDVHSKEDLELTEIWLKKNIEV